MSAAADSTKAQGRDARLTVLRKNNEEVRFLVYDIYALMQPSDDVLSYIPKIRCYEESCKMKQEKSVTRLLGSFPNVHENLTCWL